MKRAAALMLSLTLLTAGSATLRAQDASLPGPSSATHLPGAGTLPPPPAIPISDSAPVAASASGVPDENYHLGAGDKMKITIYGEEDLSGEFLVDGAGQVQFPLVGQVPAAGLSVHGFAEKLGAALGAKYLKDPKISVEILNFRPFYIMGEVNKPGEYPYENGLNVLGAVALAGGFTYRANNSVIFIRHKGDPSESAVPANSNPRVAPGDVMRIAERMF